MGIEREIAENAKEIVEHTTKYLKTEPTRRQFIKGLGIASASILLVDSSKILNSFINRPPKKTHQIFASTSEPLDEQQRIILASESNIRLNPIAIDEVPAPTLIDQLKAKRSPDGTRNDRLETQIALEVLNNVVLTKEGYEKFKAGIRRDRIGVFENVGSVLKSRGRFIKKIPKYFLYHHTAHVYEDSTNTLIEGMKRDGFSVQWNINRDAICEQFTSEPMTVGYQHAKDFNLDSEGVEMETWPGKDEADIRSFRHGVTNRPGFQGDLTAEQYEAGAYLGAYVVHELWDLPLHIVSEHLVGHRELNDKTGLGVSGKPDFNQAIMDPYRAKIGGFLPQLAS